jgi:hypothetical protein
MDSATSLQHVRGQASLAKRCVCGVAMSDERDVRVQELIAWRDRLVIVPTQIIDS